MVRCYPLAMRQSVEHALKIHVVDPVAAVGTALNLPLARLVVLYGRDDRVFRPQQWIVQYVFGADHGVFSPGPLEPQWLWLVESYHPGMPRPIKVAPHGNNQPPVNVQPVLTLTTPQAGSTPVAAATPTLVDPWQLTAGLPHHRLMVVEISNAPLKPLRTSVHLLQIGDAGKREATEHALLARLHLDPRKARAVYQE
jgi:hypothetical protein